MSTPREALQPVPCLLSLYDLLQRAEQEHPTKILVADSPFFVTADGALYDGAVVNPSFIPKREFCQGSALVYELEVIAQCVQLGTYHDTELEILQVWARAQMSVIRRGMRVSDRARVRELKRRNLLN